MIKLIAMYEKPDDEAAFMEHYKNVHMPIVEKIPGLAEAHINKVVGSPMGGEPAYFLIAEMCFPDQATFDTAMASSENRAAGKDLANFAKGKVTLLIAEE